MARQWIWLAIALVIAVAALSTIGDVRHLGERLDQFDWRALAVALALALGNYVLRFVRWQLYLARQGVTVPVASSAVVFGAGLSLSITPAKLGELVKSFLLREMHGVPAARTAPIVVAERVSDLVALLVLAVIGVAVYGVDARFVIAAGVLVAIGLVLLAWQAPTRALIDLVTRPRRLARLRGPLHETLGHLGTLCRPWPLLVATLIAVPAWGCECIGFWVICNAFPAADVSAGFAAAIYAGTTIAGALSFLPGGLGVTEGAMTLALVDGSHVDRATAVGATLLTRLATLWFAVALGVVFLGLARARIARRSRDRVL
ncbi:MAG TPA: lysylphosphatidylglycerol synthase transmembrane domain-containing protein [Kofleriaceae bacterium]|nr:lysylphosphatidylglycerol synthase transmembrane domain-containing protein [Kofleriaceae bacterium]